jgi:segregation and condensation protein B
MARPSKAGEELDVELLDLPAPARWREWMGRVEALIFASPDPVSREDLARLIGRSCNLDLLIEDIRDELRGRPYELVLVAGGYRHRTRPRYAAALRASGKVSAAVDLSRTEMLLLTAIAYFQPLTRGELGQFFGKAISRDAIARLRAAGFIGAGPRSPQPGAPYTYVTTPAFLSHFGFASLRDLPDMEKLEDAGLLGKTTLLSDFPGALGSVLGEGEQDEEAEEIETSIDN